MRTVKKTCQTELGGNAILRTVRVRSLMALLQKRSRGTARGTASRCDMWTRIMGRHMGVSVGSHVHTTPQTLNRNATPEVCGRASPAPYSVGRQAVVFSCQPKYPTDTLHGAVAGVVVQRRCQTPELRGTCRSQQLFVIIWVRLLLS